MLHKVAVIALPGVAVFELGVLCELFGSDRTADGHLAMYTRPLDLDAEIAHYGADTAGGVGVSVPAIR